MTQKDYSASTNLFIDFDVFEKMMSNLTPDAKEAVRAAINSPGDLKVLRTSLVDLRDKMNFMIEKLDENICDNSCEGRE